MNSFKRHIVCALLFGLGVSSTTLAAPFAYIPNANGGNVSVIDVATNTVIATLRVGGNPFCVGVHPAGTRAYVTNLSNSSVTVIDTAMNTVVATVSVFL